MLSRTMSRTVPALAEETIAADEPAVTAEFIEFLKAASRRRHPAGVMKRFNQGRHTGCVEATFIVADGLPADLRVGLFATPGTYPALIRFANAASATDREPDLRGMSIQVRDVHGENLTPGRTTQDFVLNSHPVMMVPGQKEFLALLQAMEAGGLHRVRYFLSRPRAAMIALAARQQPSCHLDIPYWSTTPYLFGPGRAVKYVARPCAPAASRRPHPVTATYLRDALQARLAQADGCFDFMVQFQTDARRMPIEDATVEWKERDSPFRPVARIRIPVQRLDQPGREALCEQIAFNPWHCLAPHRPLGDLNRARRAIYAAMAAFRAERASALT
jgi:hypothetical protein